MKGFIEQIWKNLPIFASEKKHLALMVTHLVISKGTELHSFPLDTLVFIIADGNYSEAITLDGHKALISMQLGQIELLMEQQLGSQKSNFIRLGRGLIINKEYIYHIDISKKLLIMSDCKGLCRELSASREALLKLKEYVATGLGTLPTMIRMSPQGEWREDQCRALWCSSAYRF